MKKIINFKNSENRKDVRINVYESKKIKFYQLKMNILALIQKFLAASNTDEVVTLTTFLSE